MSDSNCFCQLKFSSRSVGWVFIICISFLLFSCESDDGAFSYDTYDKTGFTPTRYAPYGQRTYRPAYVPAYQNPYSGAYRNPYEMYHQNPYYPSYYDQDYYYVPPTNYKNIEPEFDYGADQKS